jgi:phospholipase/carboxylesterase
VLLHGRGSDATDIISLARLLPASYAYVALRAPIVEGTGYAWFANRGIGRPVAESLASTMNWFDDWLNEFREPEQPVILVGFSGGAAFAGGLMLAHPDRYAGTAILSGTLPFDAGLATEPSQLIGHRVFLSHGRHDTVIPSELLDRTWIYLTEQSGASVTSHREHSGHELTMPTVNALNAWLLDTPMKLV